MDIFNRKRVKALESRLEDRLEEIEALQEENNNLRVCLDRAASDVNYILAAKQVIPEGCKLGPWCRGCTFGKAWASSYHANGSYYDSDYDAFCGGYICGKGESCKNFIQKKAEEK